jgi:hypothetical protein
VDPLITSGTDPALLRVLEKRGESRQDLPRRKRANAALEKVPAEERPEEQDMMEESSSDPELGSPKHTFDDLA